jgi:hypothetical protein
MNWLPRAIVIVITRVSLQCEMQRCIQIPVLVVGLDISSILPLSMKLLLLRCDGDGRQVPKTSH